MEVSGQSLVLAAPSPDKNCCCPLSRRLSGLPVLCCAVSIVMQYIILKKYVTSLTLFSNLCSKVSICGGFNVPDLFKLL
jgi:hypothetical protein